MSKWQQRQQRTPISATHAPSAAIRALGPVASPRHRPWPAGGEHGHERDRGRRDGAVSHGRLCAALPLCRRPRNHATRTNERLGCARVRSALGANACWERTPQADCHAAASVTDHPRRAGSQQRHGGFSPSMSTAACRAVKCGRPAPPLPGRRAPDAAMLEVHFRLLPNRAGKPAPQRGAGTAASTVCRSLARAVRARGRLRAMRGARPIAQKQLNMFGKSVQQPRLLCIHGRCLAGDCRALALASAMPRAQTTVATGCSDLPCPLND